MNTEDPELVAAVAANLLAEARGVACVPGGQLFLGDPAAVRSAVCRRTRTVSETIDARRNRNEF